MHRHCIPLATSTVVITAEIMLAEPDSLPGDVGPSSMYGQKVAARDHSYASLRSRSLLIAAASAERTLRRQPGRQNMKLRVLTAWSNEILCSIDVPGTLSGF
jgi:hypothetical protein